MPTTSNIITVEPCVSNQRLTGAEGSPSVMATIAKIVTTKDVVSIAVERNKNAAIDLFHIDLVERSAEENGFHKRFQSLALGGTVTALRGSVCTADRRTDDHGQFVTDRDRSSISSKIFFIGMPTGDV